MTQDFMTDMRVSVIFETKAVLPPNAPPSWDLPYFNLVAVGKTILSPHALLKKLKEIEHKLGRDFSVPRWAPRVIDLDILAYGSEIFKDEHLEIPHPELLNRPFLLQLMALLAPHWRIAGNTLSQILNQRSLPAYPCLMPFPLLVGIVNITPDSFSDGGKYFAVEQALQRIEELTKQGAAIIDIGAQSTRPGASRISEREEWQRLEPIFKQLPKCKISLDSFSPSVIEKALEYTPLDWINDVTGGDNIRLLEIVARTRCKIVLTHSLSVPAEKDKILPFDQPPMDYMISWAQRKINTLARLGISSDQIILDPGIGFGTTPLQSLQLLQQIDQFKAIGPEVLVGHSRKSFLKIMREAPDRDMETIGISHYLVTKKVDYLRIHDVEGHQRSLTASALIEGLTL